HGPVAGLEGEVVAAGRLALRGLAARAGDEQLVGPEPAIAVAAERDAERRQHGLVEAAARLEVAHHQLQVVDQAAAEQLTGFHLRVLPRRGVPDSTPARGGPVASGRDRSAIPSPTAI